MILAERDGRKVPGLGHLGYAKEAKSTALPSKPGCPCSNHKNHVNPGANATSATMTMASIGCHTINTTNNTANTTANTFSPTAVTRGAPKRFSPADGNGNHTSNHSAHRAATEIPTLPVTTAVTIAVTIDPNTASTQPACKLPSCNRRITNTTVLYRYNALPAHHTPFTATTHVSPTELAHHDSFSGQSANLLNSSPCENHSNTRACINLGTTTPNADTTTVQTK